MSLWLPGGDDVFISIEGSESQPVAAFTTTQLCDTVLLFWNSVCPPHLEIQPVNKHRIEITSAQAQRVIKAIMDELKHRRNLSDLQKEMLVKMRQGVKNGKFLLNIS